jgi:predicted amidohydrolase
VECESRAAVVQFAPIAGHPEMNLERMARETAALPGVDLIVFPELSVSGPVGDGESAERVAEPIPGFGTERLRAIAAAAGAYLVAGVVERDAKSGRLFNSAVLVGPEGVAGWYRKLHLAAEDRAWATPGDLGLPTFDIPPGRVGLLIGYDVMFPEAARSLAVDGADIIAMPSLVSWPPVLPYGETAVPAGPYVNTGPTDDHFHLWRERERENHVHVLFANGAAPAMGWSAIFAATLESEPRREALVPGNGEGRAILEIASRGLVREKSLVGMRMPIWYDAMQVPIAAAACVARERGARPEAWLLAEREALSTAAP